jgi:methylmalonyl-CoA/ethylmalonyl-CoA epimerase
VPRRIAHIGIAVRSLKDALALYRTLGFEPTAVEEVADQGTRVALLPVGESRLELLEPLAPDSPVGRFLARRGEGVHHVCFEVEDVAAEVARLRASGVRMIDESPRPGAGGCQVAFIHPAATGGVLVELSQPGAPAEP